MAELNEAESTKDAKKTKQVSSKHSLLQQPLRQRQVQQLQQVQRPLYRSRHQMLLLVRQQAVAQMLM